MVRGIKRKFGLFSLLLVATFAVQNASATYVLPESSYANDAWRGRVRHEKGDFFVTIDYAVYDLHNPVLQGETDLAESLDMSGQYLYVYQLFNMPGEYDEVVYFEILDIDGGELDKTMMNGTTSLDDETDGVAPIDPSPSEGAWEFDWGVLIAGEHSHFLLFSSDNEPTRGSYTLEGRDEDDITVVTPEPATIVLLGIGGAMALVRRRRTVR